MTKFNVGDWVQATEDTVFYYEDSDFLASCGWTGETKEKILEQLPHPMVITNVELPMDGDDPENALYSFQELPFALYEFELEKA